MLFETWEQMVPLSDLMSLHQAEMERRKSASQIAKPGCVEGSLGSAWSAELYTTTSDVPGGMRGLVFACYALRLLALNHCLVDGNKRLAWLAFVCALAAIDLSVDVTDDDAEAFVNRMVTEHLDGSSIVAWASERLVLLLP